MFFVFFVVFFPSLPICSSFYHNSFSTSFTFLALASLSFLFYPSYFNSLIFIVPFLFPFFALVFLFSLQFRFRLVFFLILLYLFIFFYFYFLYIYIYIYFFLNLYFVRPNLHLHTTKLSRVSKNTNKPFTFFF